LQPITANASQLALAMPTDFRQVARQKAVKYGLLPDVFERQIEAESGFNPKSRSSAGAQGIAQIMPDTARGWGVNPNDPVAALDAAAKNMSGYIKTYLGGVQPAKETDPAKLRVAYEKGLRAYNAGPGAVEASKGYAETNDYVKKIIDPNTFSFTEALKGKQPQVQQQQAALPQTTTPGGNTYIILGAKGQSEPADFLSGYVNQLLNAKTQIKSSIDPTAMLMAAVNQTPNYFGGEA
jgi:soluble lytic murein transglycosylase-like protein